MALPRISSLLAQCVGSDPPFPPTDLFNEGWLLRLVLDWYSRNREKLPSSPLCFRQSSSWFSEALLPSAFLARFRKDSLAESCTHADGLIGHFTVGDYGKAGCKVNNDATQFVVAEAKIYSRLSSGVKNAPYYDQAARNVACIAELLRRADRCPTKVEHLAFYVIAPQTQVQSHMFATDIDRDSIQRKVKQRVDEYVGAKDSWFNDWFLPTLKIISIDALTWEAIIDPIANFDTESHSELNTFLQQCLRYNGSVGRS
jgi:hypothetical protein